MSKQTPGEWYQSHRKIPNNKEGNYATQVYTENGETIATLSWYAMPKDENGSIGTYRDANAKLIAAAPNLLSVLLKLKEAIDAAAFQNCVHAIETDEVNMINAAITKAVGL
jgi:uncharacterized protein YegP (UPF0339 family)